MCIIVRKIKQIKYADNSLFVVLLFSLIFLAKMELFSKVSLTAASIYFKNFRNKGHALRIMHTTNCIRFKVDDILMVVHFMSNKLGLNTKCLTQPFSFFVSLVFYLFHQSFIKCLCF